MAFYPKFSETSYEKEIALKVPACGALQTQVEIKRGVEQVCNFGQPLCLQPLDCGDREAVSMIHSSDFYSWLFPLKQLFSCSKFWDNKIGLRVMLLIKW